VGEDDRAGLTPPLDQSTIGSDHHRLSGSFGDQPRNLPASVAAGFF
jgi:hypothetical protein